MKAASSTESGGSCYRSLVSWVEGDALFGGACGIREFGGWLAGYLGNAHLLTGVSILLAQHDESWPSVKKMNDGVTLLGRVV